MLPKNRTPSHPGEILKEEFLVSLGVARVAFAAHIGVPLLRVNEIVRGKRGVSPETAWLFASAMGTTPEFWINLQTAHDLAVSRPTRPVRRLRRTGCLHQNVVGSQPGALLNPCRGRTESSSQPGG